MGYICCPYAMQTDVNAAAAVHLFDKMDMECEFLNPPSEVSINTSATGSGLDSDFGASAGFLSSSLTWAMDHKAC